MKKNLLKMVAAAALAVCVLALPAMADEPEVTITYWGWDSNYTWPMMEKYHELHPNVTFEPVATEWGDMLTKAQQALASGSELPTIIPMDRALIANWKQFDILEDLKAYGLETDNYNQALIDAATTDDGRLIGLFSAACPAGIAYKRDLAKEYFGTDDPDELQAMFTTYDDYVEHGKEVAEASDGSVFLFHSGQAVAEWLYFASEVANFEDGKINMTAKMEDVMGKLIALRDAGAVDTYQNGTPEGNATYAGKNHIFYPCPDWAITYYIEANDPDGSGNWGIIKAPVNYKHGGTAFGITTSATDEQKAAAYDYICWCVSEQVGAETARDVAGFITMDSSIATPDFCKRADEEFFGGENISDLLYQEIAPNTVIPAPSAYDNDITSVRNDVAQQIMDDASMDLDAAVAAAIDELGQLVTDDSVTIE